MAEEWQKIAVIGASGKMGKGIALLLLQEQARVEAETTGKVGQGSYQLHLIDTDESGLHELTSFFKPHLTLYAEKSINLLREYFAHNPELVSNQEMIEAFVDGALCNIFKHTQLTGAKGSKYIFEAIIEEVDSKARTFRNLDEICESTPYYFSNTSSIPISVLDEKAHLGHRIIGFHFYNPPQVQRLVEIIPSKQGDPHLLELAKELVKRLKKIGVVSGDVAGFIGNGHFVREICFALQQVDELSQKISLEQAIYCVNRVTQEFLIRPMGIFQLIDYVGLDIAQHISAIMMHYLADEAFPMGLLDRFVAHGIKGGQYLDGRQKNGIFKYDEKGIQAVYQLNQKGYQELKTWKESIDQRLGPLPKGHSSWKTLHKDKDRAAKIDAYLQALEKEETLGAQLAKKFLKHSDQTAELLVKTGAARQLEDVTTVLENGFYHLYGPRAEALR